MRHRATAVATAALLALVAVGCTPERTLPDVSEQDVSEPDTTPYIEPASPPAEDVERPDDGGDASG